MLRLADVDQTRGGEVREDGGVGGGGVEVRGETETEKTHRWKILHWRCWPGWLRCLVPVAAVWSVIQQEAPFHPTVGLVEAGGRLWLAGLLWTALGLAAALTCLLLRPGGGPRPCLAHSFTLQEETVSQNTEEVERDASQAQRACQYQEGRLVAVVRAMLDGLAVSILQEPLSEPSLTQLYSLLARLEAVSRAVSEGGLPEWLLQQASEQEEDDRMSEEEFLLVARARHICTYLQDRVCALTSLLRLQAQFCTCVAGVQQGLQDHWEQLETLHSKVTLQSQTAGRPDDPHSVLMGTQSLYTRLGVFRSRVEESKTLLSTITHLLQELKEDQERLAGTVGPALGSVWIKDILQCNTEQFDKVHEEFTCLEQQTRTFATHLRGLHATEQSRAGQSRTEQDGAVSTDARPPNGVPPSALSSLPIYRAAEPVLNTDPEPPHRTRPAPSPMDYLCGLRRRR